MKKWTQDDLLSQNPEERENDRMDSEMEERYRQQEMESAEYKHWDQNLPVDPCEANAKEEQFLQLEKEELFRYEEEEEQKNTETAAPHSAGKKKLGLLGLAAFLLFGAVMFFNVHIWTDATCETPQTCRICRKTQGSELDHQWEISDCTDPGRCSLCGAESGEPYGHRWEDSICVFCGESLTETVTSPETETVPETEPTVPEITPITLKVWAPLIELDDDYSWLPRMLDAFEKAHPEYQITWENEVCNYGDFSLMLNANSGIGPDVFLYQSNDIPGLMEAGMLSRLEGIYLDSVQTDFSNSCVNSLAASDGGIYGFPLSFNTWFMYYNKDILNEEDVKSLEACLEKGGIAFPVTNSWYLQTFFIAAGGSVFGDSGVDAASGVQFGGDAGTKATNTLLDLMESPNFQIDEDGLGIYHMINGTVAAMFSGSWDYPNLKEAMGDRLGVTIPPTVEIDGVPVQLKSYVNCEAVGVNPNSENHEAAMQLAAFLASPDSQLLRYQLRGIAPAATVLADHPDITASFVTAAEMDTMIHASIAQPSIPEMKYVWDPVTQFGYDLAHGVITRWNLSEILQRLQEDLDGYMGLS